VIALADDFLIFELPGGERVPYSAESVSVELLADKARWFDTEFLQHAAKAVFHYFKHDLRREFVTCSEFSEAMEKVLGGFRPNPPGGALPEAVVPAGVLESDLWRLAVESADGCELFFFPRLRIELRQQLQHAPRVLRFHGLRGCVKHLARAQRWTARCRHLEVQIVSFLHECLGTEHCPAEFALVIE
jgi:hypothetical protein